MSDITASDLLHLPHLVILESPGKCEVVEFTDGTLAHKFYFAECGRPNTKLTVAAKIRSGGSYAVMFPNRLN